MVLARESIFHLDYFSGFFFLLLLFWLLYCIVLLEELLCSLFIYFFESRLIRTLFLILGWGYQPERVQAAIYLLFYTLLASLPLLVGNTTQPLLSKPLMKADISIFHSYPYKDNRLFGAVWSGREVPTFLTNLLLMLTT